MDKQSTLYQLMGMCMNGIMNGITKQDEDYQALLRTVDENSCRLEAMKLIDRYVSEYNAIGRRYGMRLQRLFPSPTESIPCPGFPLSQAVL